MNEVISSVVFAGSWLLVAGPLYQGSVELAELDFDREGIEGLKASAGQLERPDPPSGWWWLLPPVMYVLRRRWNKAFREATEHHDWPVWLFWVLVVVMLAAVMLAAAMLNTAARMSGDQRRPAGAEPAPAAEQR
jgi:hypothetical protein